MTSTSGPGWFRDPWQPGQLRYWSGTAWTSHTAPVGSPPPQRTGAPRRRQWSWWAFAAFVVVVTLLGTNALRAPSPGDESASEAPAAGAPTPSSPGPDPVTVAGRSFEKRVVVPRLESSQFRVARSVMKRRGIDLIVAKRLPSPQPTGSILRQRTRPGTKVAPGSAVKVVVAAPLPRVVGVVGRSVESATDRLRRAGFTVERRTSTVTSGRNGTVLSQTPVAGTPVRPGSVVTLVVAKVVPTLTSSPGAGCTPGYTPCLTPAPDYDCAGGSGNGPAYVYGVVKVTGSDPYDLDRDGDGYGCE